MGALLFSSFCLRCNFLWISSDTQASQTKHELKLQRPRKVKMDAHQRRGEEDWKPKTRQEGRELRVPLGRACKDAKKMPYISINIHVVACSGQTYHLDS